MAKIALVPGDAALALDMADLMNGPLDPEDVVKVIRIASYLVPVLEEAFAQAKVDPDKTERSETPPLRPGDRYQG